MTLELLSPNESVETYARAIARAFVGYPVMQRAFCDSPGNQEDWIFELAKRSASARQAGGLKIPCVKVDERIIAGAILSLPGQELPESQRDWFTEFLKTAGPSALDFFPRFIQILETIDLPKPSAYLVMIGVHPDFQGQGVGKKLIDYCFELANENPDNQGMGLDT